MTCSPIDIDVNLKFGFGFGLACMCVNLFLAYIQTKSPKYMLTKCDASLLLALLGRC